VGFYRTYVLPHLINFAMSNKDVAVRRAALIPKATGSVLEIGIGLYDSASEDPTATGPLTRVTCAHEDKT